MNDLSPGDEVTLCADDSPELVIVVSILGELITVERCICEWCSVSSPGDRPQSLTVHRDLIQNYLH